MQNRPITYFWGQMTYVARFKAELSQRQTSLAFLPKTPPKSFFQMAHFEEVFFYETAPSPIFGTKWTMWRILRQICCKRKVQSFLPKMPSQSFFLKTRFQFEFFYYIAPSPTWHISRKKCHDRKLRSLLPKTPGNRFSKWRVSRLYFFTKPPLTHFIGQTDYLAPFDAKLFRM